MANEETFSWEDILEGKVPVEETISLETVDDRPLSHEKERQFAISIIILRKAIHELVAKAVTELQVLDDPAIESLSVRRNVFLPELPAEYFKKYLKLVAHIIARAFFNVKAHVKSISVYERRGRVLARGQKGETRFTRGVRSLSVKELEGRLIHLLSNESTKDLLGFIESAVEGNLCNFSSGDSSVAADLLETHLELAGANVRKKLTTLFDNVMHLVQEKLSGPVAIEESGPEGDLLGEIFTMPPPSSGEREAMMLELFRSLQSEFAHLPSPADFRKMLGAAGDKENWVGGHMGARLFYLASVSLPKDAIKNDPPNVEVLRGMSEKLALAIIQPTVEFGSAVVEHIKKVGPNRANVHDLQWAFGALQKDGSAAAVDGLSIIYGAMTADSGQLLEGIECHTSSGFAPITDPRRLIAES